MENSTNFLNTSVEICGIYKITSPTNKVYVGQSSDIRRRMYYYQSLNCKSQQKLYRSLKKYGFSRHVVEIVCQCNVSELDDMERMYVKMFDSLNPITGLNMAEVDTVRRNLPRPDLSKSSFNGTSITVGVKDRYLNALTLKNYSTSTVTSYSNHLDRFILFKKQRHVSLLSSQDINDYLLHMVSNNASATNLNNAISAIRFFFKYVLNRKIKGYLAIRPKKAKTSPILLSESELLEIFRVCSNKKHLAIIYLMYGAGLRVSEIINLKIEHIDSRNNIIHVKLGKGKKDRQVMLDSKVLEALRDYAREYRPSDYLFNGQNKSPQYSVSSIQQFVKSYAIKAGISKRVHPHLFRHQFATGVLECGGDIYDAQVLLGHGSPTTTANVYAHLSSKYIASIKSPISCL